MKRVVVMPPTTYQPYRRELVTEIEKSTVTGWLARLAAKAKAPLTLTPNPRRDPV